MTSGTLINADSLLKEFLKLVSNMTQNTITIYLSSLIQREAAENTIP